MCTPFGHPLTPRAEPPQVYEAGMKKHAEEPAFVQAYLDFLHYANDEGNLRVLFERILKTLPAAQVCEPPVALFVLLTSVRRLSS